MTAQQPEHTPGPAERFGRAVDAKLTEVGDKAKAFMTFRRLGIDVSIRDMTYDPVKGLSFERNMPGGERYRSKVRLVWNKENDRQRVEITRSAREYHDSQVPVTEATQQSSSFIVGIDEKGRVDGANLRVSARRLVSPHHEKLVDVNFDMHLEPQPRNGSQVSTVDLSIGNSSGYDSMAPSADIQHSRVTTNGYQLIDPAIMAVVGDDAPVEQYMAEIQHQAADQLGFPNYAIREIAQMGNVDIEATARAYAQATASHKFVKEPSRLFGQRSHLFNHLVRVARGK